MIRHFPRAFLNVRLLFILYASLTQAAFPTEKIPTQERTHRGPGGRNWAPKKK